MSENGRTHIEYILTFLFKQGANETCCINRVGRFIANDQPKLFPKIEATLKHMDIFLQLLQGNPLFRQVEPFSACGEGTQGRDIRTSVPSLRRRSNALWQPLTV